MNYNDKYLNKRTNTLNSKLGDLRMTKAILVPHRKLKVEIVKELNESALYLFDYYVSVISNPVIDLLDDKVVGRTIGWTQRKVQTNRLKLTEHEFIYFHTMIKANVTYNTWVISKEEVSNFKKYNNSLNKLPIVVTETNDSLEVEIVETEEDREIRRQEKELQGNVW